MSCRLDELDDKSLGMSGAEFAQRIKKAVDISRVDTYRATTHNKGIFNGIDAVILAQVMTFAQWRLVALLMRQRMAHTEA